MSRVNIGSSQNFTLVYVLNYVLDKSTIHWITKPHEQWILESVMSFNSGYQHFKEYNASLFTAKRLSELFVTIHQSAQRHMAEWVSLYRRMTRLQVELHLAASLRETAQSHSSDLSTS